jgi:hypothetical protein
MLPEINEDYYDYDDGDDFIVGSDEEREEQQKAAEEIAMEREKRRKRKEKGRRHREREELREKEREDREGLRRENEELIRIRAGRTVIVLDEEEEGKGRELHGSNDGGKDYSPDRPAESEQESSSEEEEEEDDDEEEVLDGPMMYRQLDAMRDEERERDDGALGIQKVVSHPEALMLYIEMLGHAHMDPTFISQCADVSLGTFRAIGALCSQRSHDKINRRHNPYFTPSSSSSSSSSSSLRSGISKDRIRQYLSASRYK